jgi:hypothetical protein
MVHTISDRGGDRDTGGSFQKVTALTTLALLSSGPRVTVGGSGLFIGVNSDTLTSIEVGGAVTCCT